MKPRAAPEEWFKLQHFPFSLTGLAKAWFLSLPSNTVRTWEQMKKKFVDKYCPPAKANQLRKELSTIRQGPSETMYEYLERFSTLEQSCSIFGLSEKMVVEYLLDGLKAMERMMLEAAAGGSVMNLTPTGVRNLISEVAESARFREESARREDVGRTRTIAQVEVENTEIQREVKELRETMQKMLSGQVVQIKACEFCKSVEHKTEECPQLHQPDQADVNAMGFQNFNRGQPGKFGLNPNNFSWKSDGVSQQKNQNPSQNTYQPPFQQYVPYPNQQQQQQRNPSQPHQAGGIYEEMFKRMDERMNVQAEEQKDMKRTLQQLVTAVAELREEKGRLSSQVIPNPKAPLKAVTLRNGRELKEELKIKRPQKIMDSNEEKSCLVEEEVQKRKKTQKWTRISASLLK